MISNTGTVTGEEVCSVCSLCPALLPCLDSLSPSADGSVFPVSVCPCIRQSDTDRDSPSVFCSVCPLGSPVRLCVSVFQSWHRISRQILSGLSVRLPGLRLPVSCFWPVCLSQSLLRSLCGSERRSQPVQTNNCPSQTPTHALRAKFTLPDSPSPDLPV